jgi:hypothetical protein
LERLEPLEQLERVYRSYPTANPTTPNTIAQAPARRRGASASPSKRVPMTVPIKILISRAGAT